MEKCIICNEKKTKFSIEHVIPDSLGGTIKCFQVCETCNNLLGKKLMLHSQKLFLSIYLELSII